MALAAQLLLTTPLVRFVEVFCFEVSADVWECGREVEGFGELFLDIIYRNELGLGNVV